MVIMDFLCTIRMISPRLQPYLPDIICSFKTEISSNRSMSYINTFEDLVKILIKRDVIGPSIGNWARLNDVSLKYLGETLEDAARHRQTVLKTTTQPSFCPNGPSNVCNFEVSAHHREEPHVDPRVVNFIADHIGEYQWRPLARALKVKESDIARLERRDPIDAVHEILHLFVKRIPNPSERDVRSVLIKGLTNIRRQDLVEEVSKYF